MTSMTCVNPDHPDYYLTDDTAAALKDLDVLLTEFHSLWWRSTVSKEWLHTALVHSYCISIIHEPTNQRVGFARCITDYCGFSRLTDVYVLFSHRRKGLATWMLRWIVNTSRVKDVAKHELVCLDREVPLYSSIGFNYIGDELKYMDLKRS